MIMKKYFSDFWAVSLTSSRIAVTCGLRRQVDVPRAATDVVVAAPSSAPGKSSNLLRRAVYINPESALFHRLIAVALAVVFAHPPDPPANESGGCDNGNRQTGVVVNHMAEEADDFRSIPNH